VTERTEEKRQREQKREERRDREEKHMNNTHSYTLAHRPV